MDRRGQLGHQRDGPHLRDPAHAASTSATGWRPTTSAPGRCSRSSSTEWFGPEESPGQPDAADVIDRPGPEWDDPRHDEPEDQAPGDSAERSPGPSKDSGQRALVIKILDEFRDDPLGDTDKHSDEVTALIQLTRHLLHATGTRNVRQLVREQLLALSGQQDPALAAHATTKAREDAKRKLGEQCRQFEFTLLLSVLHTRLDMMTEMWPRVEAALNLVGTSNVLSRRPPEDYRPLVPESPMGNILGFQFQPDSSAGEPQSGALRFFRCAGSGRELLLGLHGPDRRRRPARPARRADVRHQLGGNLHPLPRAH